MDDDAFADYCRRAANGDESARKVLAELVTPLFQGIACHIVRINNCPDVDSLDLAQDASLQFFRPEVLTRIASSMTPISARAYIKGIGWKSMITSLRKRKRTTSLTDDIVATQTSTDVHDPRNQLERDELLQKIHDLMNAYPLLTFKEKGILRQLYSENKSLREIAASEKKPVHVIIYSVKKILKTMRRFFGVDE